MSERRWAADHRGVRGRHASATPRSGARVASVWAVALVVVGLVLAGTTLLPWGGGVGAGADAEDLIAAGSAGDPVEGSTGDTAGRGRGAEVLWPADRWLERFDADWSRERPAAVALSASPDSWDHYPLAYSVDALTAAYRASGDTAYLSDGLTLLEGVVATARPSPELTDSRYGDGYRGWVSAREDVAGQEVPLFESYLWRYGTHLLAVASASGGATADPATAARVDALVGFVERDVFDKWFSRGPEGTVYRERTHMSAHWAFIAMDLYRLTGDGERRTRCAEVVRAITEGGSGERHSLAAQLVPSEEAAGALFWSDEWGSYREPGQDVAHGNNVVAYLVEAHDRDAGWPASTVGGLGATFTEVVWPAAPREDADGAPGTGRGAEFVDGSGEGSGWFSDGWVKLGRYDPALQRRLQGHDVANGQFVANGALNAAILACDGAPPAGQEPAPPACTPLPPWRQALPARR